ncbi:hypothetical protein GCM10022243_36990 [Saccharothrix violaceirubra]|uniref:DUF3153 domain-containing protein n=1 Tax=Saccharothrix violaceirubra TaxID=413306 RepID=A0A7W7T501_9PSEU|nr:hypothetical protein [Saccharothrix violaceirubra]MBB4966386.1 hypothetical protein [Saccharothrix violaceirubra]
MRRLPVLLLLLLAAAGCAMVTDLTDLATRLENEGYTVVRVHHDVTNAVDTLTVEVKNAVTSAGEKDPAEVAWTKYTGELDELVVRLDGRESTYSAIELERRFGPRDEQSSSTVPIVLAVLFVVGCVVTAVVVVAAKRDRAS